MHFYAFVCTFRRMFLHCHAFVCIFVQYPQMVFDHNLYYMAPFAIPRAGFCTEFRRASFVFSCPGLDFERLRVRFSGLGVDIPARGRFWLVLGCGKRWFCKGVILWGVGREIHPAQMNSIVRGTHLGRLLCPKPWLFGEICANPDFPENWEGPQLISWWDPYSALGIPIVPVGSLFWRNKVPWVYT